MTQENKMQLNMQTKIVFYISLFLLQKYMITFIIKSDFTCFFPLCFQFTIATYILVAIY